MSWQLAAFGLLFIALAGGLSWYERRRPDARVVALVATLAALAALGRIAFAALPNVKPTTDIVLISGYALGAGPGFAVGAFAGLTSNFFFGQGPWTPWQMAAWGATGLIGAGLATATGRRINRWTLAAVCLVAGFAFTAFQDVGDWVTYSDHSLGQLGVYVGQGLGFDAIHAVGCLVFALAFGPALARSIRRFATRLEVTWVAPEAAVALIGALSIGAVLASSAARTATAAAVSTPVSYLLSAQNSDGGFGSAPGQPSSQLYAGWAALGLASEGVNLQDVHRGAAGVAAYLASGVGSDSDPGSLERTILAVRAAGLPATSFGGRDLVSALRRDFRSNGSISNQTNWTAFALLALRAAGASPPGSAAGWLIRQQDRDGGFGYGIRGGTSDADDTGAALEALAGVSGGRAHAALTRAVAYLTHHQDRDGGFAAFPGSGSDSQSTAWAVQGLLAAGVNPSGVRRGGGPSPLDYLNSLIAPDGHVRYSASSNETPVWVTAEAVMALAGKPLPITAPASTASHGASSTQPRKARAAQHTKPAAKRRARHKHSRRSRVQAPAADPAMSYLGLLDALLLDPVGLG